MHTHHVSDFYMPMLLNLSDDDKLDLIARLSFTMHSVNKKKARPDIRHCFSGDWENDKPTHELAREWRTARHYEAKDLKW